MYQVGGSGVFLAAFHHGQGAVLGGGRGVCLQAAAFQGVGAGVVGTLHGAHGAGAVDHGGGDGIAVGGAGGHAAGGDVIGQLQRHVLFSAHCLRLRGGAQQAQGDGDGCGGNAWHGQSFLLNGGAGRLQRLWGTVEKLRATHHACGYVRGCVELRSGDGAGLAQPLSDSGA